MTQAAICWLRLCAVAALMVPLVLGSASEAQEAVARVIDGDTLVLASGERIRIAGVDAPERRCRCAQECRAAREATALVAFWTSDGAFIHRLRRDRYGRTLAIVTSAGGIDVARSLIARALGREYRGERRRSWCDAGTQDGRCGAGPN